MRVYLIDASALVTILLKRPSDEVLPAKTRLAKLLASRKPGEGPIFYVPNFCMAECSNALARIFVNGTPKGADDYRKHVDALLDLVSSKRTHLIQTYKLAREHLVDIEEIFITDKRLPLRGHEKYLSGLDGLIIAMAKKLSAKHEPRGNQVIVLTCEKRMARVCAQSSDFPIAVDILNDEIPGT